MRPISSSVVTQPAHWRTRASTKIVFNVGIALVGVVIARILGSVTQIVLARLMGVADFGMYTTLYTLLGPVIMITSLGLDTWLLRQTKNTATLNTAIGQVFVLRVIATAILMLLAVMLVAATGRASITVPIVLAALGLTVELLLTTAHTALRAQVRNRAASLLQILVAGCTVLLIVFFWKQRLPLLAATGYRLIADALGLALVFWLLRHSLRLDVWRSASLSSMLKQAMPYFASDLLSTTALKADLTIVALLLGAIGAGIYGPALTIINTTFLIPTVAWQVLLPILSHQHPRSRTFRLTLALMLIGNVLYGICWAAILWWKSDFLITLLFQAAYLDAVPLLRIMSLIPLLKSINFCWALVMVARDRQVFRTKLLSIGAAFNVLGNVVSIPFFGLVGAATINLITEVVLLICYTYGAWHTLQRYDEHSAA